MKAELVRLLKVLEDTVPKYEMKRHRVVKLGSDMSSECKALFDHLLNFNSIVVRKNRFGLDCIEGTDIRVLSSMANPNHIESRYGMLIIPCKVRMM